MSRITITSKDAEKVAKAFSDLIAEKGLLRIRRKAVNRIGAAARKETRSVLPAVVGTSIGALMVQGRAASPGSDNPKYSLRMARKVPVVKLKAARRKITKRRGRASLVIQLPTGDKIAFRSVRREGPMIRLLEAGPLVERSLGGVFVNASRAFTDEGYPELSGIRRRAERELPAVVQALIMEHLRGRK